MAPEVVPQIKQDWAILHTHAKAFFDLDEDWGTLVWLVMTTGIRRGEACAFLWTLLYFDEGITEVRTSYTKLRGVG
jgi:hypothetical protein